MQFADVLAQLNTLPSTFTRTDPTFASIQAAKAAGLFRYTNASDGITAQVQAFSNAYGVWLDAWGKLFVIPRNANERDDLYMHRISAVLIAGRGTPVAIEQFVFDTTGVTATVTEDLVNCAWSLQLGQPLSAQGFQDLVDNLKFVRPAGVPFLKAQSVQRGGLYAGSVDYTNAPRVTGAYLKTPVQTADTAKLSAYTNNSVPLLPTTFLTDPTINPGLPTG